jgi:hypothetical protein
VTRWNGLAESKPPRVRFSAGDGLQSFGLPGLAWPSASTLCSQRALEALCGGRSQDGSVRRNFWRAGQNRGGGPAALAQLSPTCSECCRFLSRRAHNLRRCDDPCKTEMQGKRRRNVIMVEPAVDVQEHVIFATVPLKCCESAHADDLTHPLLPRARAEAGRKMAGVRRRQWQQVLLQHSHAGDPVGSRVY